MQIILDSQNKSVVKIEKGEDVIEVIKSFAKDKDKSFTFSIIGACSYVELAYYDLEKRAYFTKVFEEKNIEIVSVTGNVAWFESEPAVHMHGVFSNERYETFGGHINKLVVSATGETIIDYLPEKIKKAYDEGTGLKLMCM